MIVAAALLVVASLLGVAALSLVIVGVGRNRRKGGFAGRNQPVDDRLPDKLTALGRDRCQRLQLFGIMFSCHFHSPSVCKTMLTGQQRIPARANAPRRSRQVPSGWCRRKDWLTCHQDRGKERKRVG